MAKKHDIIWMKSVDSTNNEAKRRISDIDNLSVLSALEQTAGRGQRGNTWTSDAGANLMFSIVLKSPSLIVEDHFILNEIAALSVADFLSTYGIKAEIKWPNDIYVHEKKICGILIENSFHRKSISYSIIGIGLNINQRNFDVNLPNPTSMVLCRPTPCCNSVSSQSHSAPFICHSERSEDTDEVAAASAKESFDIKTCLNGFMDIFTTYHDRFLTSACDLSTLRRLYLDSLWRLGKPSRFIDYTTLPAGHCDGPMNICTEKVSDTGILSSNQYGNEFPGIIRGLSPTGNLLVEDLSTGLTREFGFKEIGYIL